MASQTNCSFVFPEDEEEAIGHPTPPFSTTPPPPRRRQWWSRPIAFHPAFNDRQPTFKEKAAYCSPCCGGLFTFVAVILILYFADKAHCHAKFSIQSITVSPSPATWHVDFLVKNPSSRYTIYYEGDDAAVRLGFLNAAVLNCSHKRDSPSHTAFSVDFVAEGNPDDVGFGVLEIKLRAKHMLIFNPNDDAGRVVISCHNLTRNRHDNIDKIKCHSSFSRLETLEK